MILTANDIRKQFTIFDKSILPWKKVSTTAVIKDRPHTVPTREEFERDFLFARSEVARRFGVTVRVLPFTMGAVYNLHEYDCDDFARDACSIVIEKRRKLSMQDGANRFAYPIFPADLLEKHTINICVTQQGLCLGDLQAGTLWSLEEQPTNVIHIG